jgi:hypothetical protein
MGSSAGGRMRFAMNLLVIFGFLLIVAGFAKAFV